MNTAEHKKVGPAMHDRIIGALETCCRQGEMLRIQNRDVDWTQHQIVISGANAKRRGEPAGSVRSTRPARSDPEAKEGSWTTGVRVRLIRRRVRGQLQNGLGVASAGRQWTPDEAGQASSSGRPQEVREIDLHWHDLRHEGACRLLADGVDIRVIQLVLGHSDIKTTQRYLNITDEELRKVLTGVCERRRQLKAVNQ
jgi:integrase